MSIQIKLGLPIPGTQASPYQNVKATLIPVGTTVVSDQYWCASPNQEFVLIMQRDGNLVLYQVIGSQPIEPGVEFTGEPIWASGTVDPGDYLVVQLDGNVVIYNSAGVAVWSTRTAGDIPTGLYLQDDGNLVVYVLNPAWASAT